MPVYIVIQIFSAGVHSTRGSTRGPRGRKKVTSKKPVKAFLVAGGHEGSHTSSSVLMLLHGAPSWTPVASLPGILYQARASVVGGNMRVTGGRPGPPGGNTEVRNRRDISSPAFGANSSLFVTF